MKALSIAQRASSLLQKLEGGFLCIIKYIDACAVSPI